MPQALNTINLQWPRDRDTAIAGEKVRRLLERGEMDDCVDAALELLEQFPDLNHVRNNLARALWERGEATAAIRHQEEALRRDPTRPSGLSSMVRFCTLTGRTEDARRWAEVARSHDLPRQPDMYAYLEIAAFRDDRREIRRILEQFDSWDDRWKIRIVEPVALIAGTAFARDGDVSEARRWWNSVRAHKHSADEARIRLQELDRPEGDRTSPWYFSLYETLPRAVADALLAIEMEQQSKRLASILEKYPDLTAFVPYLIDQSDDFGRWLGLGIADYTNAVQIMPSVVELITGNRIRSERKDQAFKVLSRYDKVAMPRETLDYETRFVNVRGFEISMEPTEETPDDIRDLYVDAYELLQEGKAEEAETLSRERVFQSLPYYVFNRSGG